MTVPFRINAFEAHAAEGTTRYKFDSPLTVIAGPIAVGKSTLFEAMKFALGCDALLTSVIRANVVTVTIDVTVGTRRFTLRRETTGRTTSRVKVNDVIEGRQLDDHFVGKGEPSLNSLLLTSLGLSDDMLAASTSSSTTKKGNRITFADVFKYMYVPQSEINREIAGSDDSYYTPKRKAVFELLFDLTSPALLQLQSNLNVARGKLDELKAATHTVDQFLKDSKTPSRFELEVRQAEARITIETADRLQAEVRSAIAPTIDGETQVMRELLVQSEVELESARQQSVIIHQQVADYEREILEVAHDISHLERMSAANERLARIEFTTCPRCMQKLANRPAPADHCRLCLLPETVATASSDQISPELEHLRPQSAELKTQLKGLRSDLDETLRAAEARSALVVQLSDTINARTALRVTPQLQSYADAAASRATASAVLSDCDERLQLWDRADDLAAQVAEQTNEIDSLKDSLKWMRSALESRKTEVLAELEEEFLNTVLEIGVPGAVTATIDPASYLPKINGENMDTLSPAGGLRTTTIVSYWFTLLTVALRRHDTLYPAFLLIDSPRTSLNDSDDLSAALYRRLVTLVDSAQSNLQLIVGDNELPSAYRRDYAQMNFSYNEPTIRTAAHPGPAQVERVPTKE